MADDGKNGWTVDTLKEHFDRLRQTDKEAVVAALNAADKAVSAALESANKAADKGEEAQLRVNITQNEFRGQLKDQAATLMSRTEATVMNEQLQAQIETIKNQIPMLISRTEAVATDNRLQVQIDEAREQRAILLPRGEYNVQHESLQLEVDGLKKLVYIGLGGLGAIQFVLAIFVN